MPATPTKLLHPSLVVLHLVGIFHTQHTAAYSHCAFTGKALRFPKMMQGQGYAVIEALAPVAQQPE